MQKSARWTVTINIVSCLTVLSVHNSAVIWTLLSPDNLDFIAIEILDPTVKAFSKNNNKNKQKKPKQKQEQIVK